MTGFFDKWLFFLNSKIFISKTYFLCNFADVIE